MSLKTYAARDRTRRYRLTSGGRNVSTPQGHRDATDAHRAACSAAVAMVKALKRDARDKTKTTGVRNRAGRALLRIARLLQGD